MSVMIYKNKKAMKISYMKDTIIRQVAEGQYGFSRAMYTHYKQAGGKLTYLAILRNSNKIDKFHYDNAKYGYR